MRDETATWQPLAIVERYERVVSYLYPILQTAPRRHGVARDEMLRSLFGVAEQLIQAGKSRQISRLYAVDASLGVLRFWLRFMASWRGHASHADAHNLLRSLLGDER